MPTTSSPCSTRRRRRATIVGHSMGAFVAVVAAHRHPQRVAASGPRRRRPAPRPRGAGGEPIDTIVATIIGPALDRLRLTFESVEAYLDYWRRHPAFAADWNAWIEDAFVYDLEGDPPSLHSGVREAASLPTPRPNSSPTTLPAPSTTSTSSRAATGPGRDHGRATRLVHRGLARPVAAATPTLRDALIPDVNHYTILLSERGVAAVAQIVAEQLGT